MLTSHQDGGWSQIIGFLDSCNCVFSLSIRCLLAVSERPQDSKRLKSKRGSSWHMYLQIPGGRCRFSGVPDFKVICHFHPLALLSFLRQCLSQAGPRGDKMTGLSSKSTSCQGQIQCHTHREKSSHRLIKIKLLLNVLCLIGSIQVTETSPRSMTDCCPGVPGTPTPRSQLHPRQGYEWYSREKVEFFPPQKAFWMAAG